MRVAKKSVKGGLNLQDLLCLTIFIYIIYLLTILLPFRLLGLKSIYVLRKHHTKSIAESSYSLLWGREFSLQMSLPGDIPKRVRERRARIYTESQSHVALTGPYGAVRGNTWSGERHVTVRPSHN
jgi:hypothetical protein